MMRRRTVLGLVPALGLAPLAGLAPLLAPIGAVVWSPAAVAARRAMTVGAEWDEALMVSWVEVDVAATPADAFAVVTDYARLAEFLPGVLASRVASRAGETVEVDQELEESVLFFRQRLKVRMAIDERPPYRLTLRLVSGSFRFYEGQYVLLPLAGDPGGVRTRISYRARFEPDFDLPRLMGPFIVKRSLEKNFRALVEEIERRVARVAGR